MSNSSSKRPRRSFATAAAPTTSQPHPADDLKYDGEDVPVLIRLPDLSPQVLLRESAPAAPQLAPTAETQAAEGKLQLDGGLTDQAARQEPTSTELTQTEPGKTKQTQAKQTQTKPDKTKSTKSSATGKRPAATAPSTDDESPSTPRESQPGRSAVESTQGTSEGSVKKSRRRKRHAGQQERQPSQVQSAAGRESRRSAKRRQSAGTTSEDRNVLAFDPSRLLIGVGLVVVAGLTYFALSGGSEDAADPTWSGSEADKVVQTAEPIVEPEADLWPARNQMQVNQEDPSHAQQASADVVGQADVTAWPQEQSAPAVSPAVNGYDAATLPAADYSFNAPPITAPANGQNVAAPIGGTAGNAGATSGWPDESTTPTQPTSTTQPISSWPDAAMAPSPTAPSGAPNGYYQSQAAGYTTSPATSTNYGETPAVRTGRLEAAGSYPADSNTTTNPGSQLNGTIEIPRPRANNEYNGSNVY